MPGWSTSWFFFLFVAFLIYVTARGDWSQWKQIFSGSLASTTPSVTPGTPGTGGNAGNGLPGTSSDNPAGTSSLPGISF